MGFHDVNKMRENGLLLILSPFKKCHPRVGYIDDVLSIKNSFQTILSSYKRFTAQNITHAITTGK